jgi:hypothetical protein
LKDDVIIKWSSPNSFKFKECINVPKTYELWLPVKETVNLSLSADFQSLAISLP